MRIPILALLALTLVLAPVGVVEGQQPPTPLARLLRFPDINGDKIAFVYGGDIWTVESAGGMARRLTSDVGLELFPKFSPDGRWIAFSGEYGGTRQVYVIGVDGGQPRQLTYHNDIGRLPYRGGFDHQVLGWSPDGKNVVFKANRVPYSERLGRAYVIPFEGGTETPLPMPRGGSGCYSPDGTRFVYTPYATEFRGWKRYMGGQAPDLWIYDLAKNASEKITDFKGTDNQPVWLGDTIYFTSDRDRILNIYAYDVKSRQTRKVTSSTSYDVLWPSGRGNSIVYEQGGYIYRLDVTSGRSEQVPIRVYGDLPATMPTLKNVSRNIEASALSPTGVRAVFSARGDIFSVPVKEGEIRNLTNSQGVRELSPSWSPDARWISYLSDRAGEYELYVRPADGSGPERRVTNGLDIWCFYPIWSPDSTKLLFGDKGQRLRYVDVESGRITQVDTTNRGDFYTYTWAPDSKWIAYTKLNENDFSSIWVHSLADGKNYRLTSGSTDDGSPVFDPKGRFLYFLSNRDFNLTFSSYEFNYVYTNPTRVYVATLAADGPTPFVPTSDDEKPSQAATPTSAASPPAGEAKAETAPAPPLVKIDVAGFENRVRAVPGDSADYRRLTAVPDGVLYLRGQGPGTQLQLFNIETKKEQSVLVGISEYDVSADNKMLIYQSAGAYGVVPIAPAQKVGEGTLKLDNLVMKVDPRAEWAQEYVDGWRIMRDWFYDPKMHGQDWIAVRDKYAGLVPFIATRYDLDFVLTEMTNEVCAGHVYIEGPGDDGPVSRRDGALLGAEFAPDSSGYFKITKIFPGENWHGNYRSPLTEPGVRVAEGDFVLAVDGRSTNEVKNFYELLEGKAGRVVTLLVNNRPDPSGAHEERVRTVSSEQGLRYLDWVKSRREYVDQASGGRIGYIHVPDTAVAGNRELFKYFYPQVEKQALIIDDRFNGGGFIPDRMIELLARRPLSYWTRRGGEVGGTPRYANPGPKVMLINGNAGSGGDALPYYFRERGLGPLIGTRTWGGLIGLSGNPALADGGSVEVPTFRFITPDGKWAIENEGVAPDIEVEDRPELVAAGRDPSLEMAIKVLLEQLEKNPPRRIVAPVPPDLSK
jgi:tricorn protease